jgi:predicted metal-dependent hydrolase
VFGLYGPFDNMESPPQTREQILEKQIQRIANLVTNSPVFLAPTEFLDKQLGAVFNITKSRLQVADNLLKRDYSLQEKRLKYLEEALESEKRANEILTEELEKADNIINSLVP